MSNGNRDSSRQVPLDAAATATVVAQQSLRASAYASVLNEVRCEGKADAVILRGRVSSFYFKQLAQEVVRKVDGGYRIVNELEVEDGTRATAGFERPQSEPYSLTETPGITEARHGCSNIDRG